MHEMGDYLKFDPYNIQDIGFLATALTGFELLDTRHCHGTGSERAIELRERLSEVVSGDTGTCLALSYCEAELVSQAVQRQIMADAATLTPDKHPHASQFWDLQAFVDKNPALRA